MDKIKANLDTIIEKIKKDYDYCLVITGRKRRGKSTLAYHCGEYISSALGSKFWDCYNYSEMREALFRSKKYDVIFGDETIGFLSSGKWFTPEAQEFIELFDRMGYKNLTTILIMPSFKSFLKGLREDRIDCHFWLPTRGEVWVYPAMETKDGCYFANKPALKDTFPPLPKDVEKEYRKRKERSMDKRIEELREFGYDPKGTLYRLNAWLKSEGYTQKERAKRMNVHERTIARWDKKWEIEQAKKGNKLSF